MADKDCLKSMRTLPCIDPIHLTSSSEKSCMHHTGEQCLCALFSEVRILGNAAFTRKPIANQNGEHGTVAGVKSKGFSVTLCNDDL